VHPAPGFGAPPANRTCDSHTIFGKHALVVGDFQMVMLGRIYGRTIATSAIPVEALCQTGYIVHAAKWWSELYAVQQSRL
jgi:hypothetical protein